MTRHYRPKSKWGYGFKLDYPPEFNDEFKRYIRKRDHYRCAICNFKRRMDVHHIDYNRYHTVKSNCISLCRSCHTVIHQSSTARKLKFRQKLSLLAMQREGQDASSR